MPQDWMKDPLLAGIDPAKMALLNSFVSQGTGKSQNEIVSLLMPPPTVPGPAAFSLLRMRWKE